MLLMHSHRVHGPLGGGFVTSLIQERLANDTQNTVLCVHTNFARNIHAWTFWWIGSIRWLVFVFMCVTRYVYFMLAKFGEYIEYMMQDG